MSMQIFLVSALVAIDKCSKENGTLELAKSHKGNFDQLYENTKKDGTPALSVKLKLKQFKVIDMEIGDVIIFSNSCPHRSKRIILQKQGELFIILIHQVKMDPNIINTSMIKIIAKI